MLSCGLNADIKVANELELPARILGGLTRALCQNKYKVTIPQNAKA